MRICWERGREELDLEVFIFANVGFASLIFNDGIGNVECPSKLISWAQDVPGSSCSETEDDDFLWLSGGEWGIGAAKRDALAPTEEEDSCICLLVEFIRVIADTGVPASYSSFRGILDMVIWMLLRVCRQHVKNHCQSPLSKSSSVSHTITYLLVSS